MALVNNTNQVKVVISSGGSLSTEGDIAPLKLVGLATDANWTPQLVSFQTSLDGTTFLPVQGSAGALSFGTLAASSVMVLDPAIFRFPGALKVQSGPAAAGVNQSNTTTLTLLCATIS